VFDAKTNDLLNFLQNFSKKSLNFNAKLEFLMKLYTSENKKDKS